MPLQYNAVFAAETFVICYSSVILGPIMEIKNAFNIRVIEIEQKTLIVQIEIEPHSLKYQAGIPPVRTYEWLHAEDWIAIYEAIESAVKVKHWLENDGMKTLSINRRIELRIHKENSSAKQICQLLRIKTPAENDVILLHAKVSYQEEQQTRPSSSCSIISEQHNYFVGFEDINVSSPIQEELAEVELDERFEANTRLQPINANEEACNKSPSLPDSGNELIAPSPQAINDAFSRAENKRKTRKHKSEAEKLIDGLTQRAKFENANKREYARKARLFNNGQYNEDSVFKDEITKETTVNKTPLKTLQKQIDESELTNDRDNFEKPTPKRGRPPKTDKRKRLDSPYVGDIADLNECMQLRTEDDDCDLQNFESPLLKKTPLSTVKKKAMRRKRKLYVTANDFARAELAHENNELISKNQNKDSAEKSKISKPAKNNGKAADALVTTAHTASTRDEYAELDDNLGTQDAAVATDNLTLDDLSPTDIIKTFDRYKPLLDVIFKKEKSKGYVHSWQGVNHIMVMNLTESCTQMEIMQKLCDEYEPQQTGPCPYTTLFANAMMPEWLINILMEKYNFSRAEALQRLEALERT